MSITLITVMISQAYAYVQTYQTVHIKYMSFSVYQLHLNTTVFFLRSLFQNL